MIFLNISTICRCYSWIASGLCCFNSYIPTYISYTLVVYRMWGVLGFGFPLRPAHVNYIMEPTHSINLTHFDLSIY